MKESNKHRLMVVFASAALAACQAIPSPSVRAFGDNMNWVLLEDMRYRIGNSREEIVVPAGFVTDFASIPGPLWSFGLSPYGEYSRAAIVHDYLYWTQGCSKEQSDRLLLIAMKESQVSKIKEEIIYLGVSWGGEGAWKSNKLDRERNIPRIIPVSYREPDNPNVGWSEYRKKLIQDGVRDPDFEKSPTYCIHGNSTEVPTH